MNNEEFAEKLVKGFSDSKLRPSMFVIVNYCIDEVGEEKDKIIDKVKSMVNDEELSKAANSSFISKQLLKPFSLLNIDEREKVLDELSKVIENYSASNTEEDIPSKKLYSTKNTEISFKLDSNYKIIEASGIDFWAKYNDNLELVSCIYHFSIFDKDKKEQLINDCYKFGKDYLTGIDSSFIQYGDCEITQNRKIRALENGLSRAINQSTKTYTFESDSKMSKLSIVLLSGEGFFNKMYVILLIQTCNKEDFSKYESIINDNISSSIEHTVDTSEKKIELVDNTLGKMILKVDEDRAEAVVKEADIDMSMLDDAELIFGYGDDSLKNLDDFLYYKEEYLRALNNVIKYKDQIKSALYRDAKEIYDNWLEQWYTPEEITEEFVRKSTSIVTIRIYRDAASISADYYDDIDEDRDLGGHGFDIFLNEEDFNNKCENVSWTLNG